MKNRFDLIVFDWDGTLYDSVDWIVQCIQAAAAQQNLTIPSAAAIKDIIGLSVENAMQTLFPETLPSIRQQLILDYSQAFFAKPFSCDNLFPEVPAMLATLKNRGYRLAIATGKKSSSLNQILAATGLAEFFCAIRCADQSESKPNPAMLNEIVTELTIPKHRTVVVGDSIHDLQMAINAEIAAIAVSCGAHSRQRLEQFQPLVCLNYATDLIDIL